MEPAGIVKNMPHKKYLSEPGFSTSGLKEFSRSPSHYQYFISEIREATAATAAMLIGSALHTAVLEPDKYTEEVAVTPDINKRTKAGKAEYTAFLEANRGKYILSPDDAEKVQKMAEKCHSHPVVKELLSSGDPEISLFWNDPQHDFRWKGRADWITGGGAILDVKTCVDASLDGFQKAVGNFKYGWQAALYLEGLSILTGKKHDIFLWIAIENKPPHEVAVWQADFFTLDAGSRRVRQHAREYAECKEKNEWPGYWPEIQKITIGKWAA